MATKKELEAMVEELQAKLNGQDAPQTATEDIEAMKEQNRTLSDRVEQLTMLMLANKAQDEENEKRTPDNEETVTVRNVSGSALGFEVTDVTGRPRRVKLPQKNATARLTPMQLHEAKDKSPHYFDNGWVAVDGEVSDNPNLITDMEAFLESLPASEVKERIESITSMTTLTQIFNYIETLRFQTADRVEGEGDDSLRSLDENDIDPKLIAIEIAVQRRLAKMHGVRLSLDDS